MQIGIVIDRQLIMKWASLLFICFFLLANTSRAQEHPKQVNTLYKVNKTEDTNHIFKLIEQSRVINREQPDSAISLLQQAFKESYAIRFYDGMTASLLGMGVCNTNKGNYQKSIDLFNLALVYAQRATIYKDRLLVQLYNAMGVPYSCMGDYQSAIDYYLKALKEIERQKTVASETYILVYCNLGGIFIETEQYGQALYYLKKMEGIAMRNQCPDSLMGDLYTNIATAYGGKNDFKNQSQYIQKLKALGEKYNNRRWQQKAATSAGSIFLKQGMPQKAIPLLLHAMELTDTSNTITNISVIASLSNAYYQAKDYKRTRELALLALDKSKQAGLQNNLVVKIHSILFSTYADQHKYEQAYKSLLSYTILKDSLLSLQRNKAIHSLEVKYRTSEKDKDIAKKQLFITQQEKKIEKRNNWLISGICGAMLLVLLMIAMFRSYRHKQRLQQEKIRNLQQEQELLHKEKEIDNLKAMINGEEKERSRIARELHDGIVSQLSGTKMLFSTIQEKYKNLFGDNELEEAIEQLKDITADLRKTAHNLTPDILIQGGLAEAIRIFIEKVNHSSPIHITLHLFTPLPAFNADFELSVYRMIQELVQNIEKHAHATEVLIQLHTEGELFSITVEDNGKGMDTNLVHNHAGIGLKNMDARVKALNGHWDIQSTVNVGTTVYIEFDISNFLKTAIICV